MKTIDYKLTNKIKISTTTRLYGHSPVPYESLNMSYEVGDNKFNVARNREILPSIYQKSPELNKLLVEGEDDLILFTNDELVCVIYEKKLDKIFMFKLDKEDGISLKAKEYLDIMKDKYNVDFNNVKIYLAPALDFDECYLNIDEVNKLNELGYLFTTKCTDNKYTYDLKWHTYVILKEYGVNNEDIYASPYQTNQYPKLLFTKTKEKVTGKMATYVLK